MSRPFQSGERALLLDAKGRRYLVSLAEGGEFHTHSGPVLHDDVLGHDEGVVARSTGGARYLAVRPTLADVVLKMPRGAQVIYPKDLGPLLILADIYPGAKVLESGLGSGALSMTLLRAGAVITGYEIRADFAARARANVVGFLGHEAESRYDVEVRDVYEGIDTDDLDRIMLDLPEPWRVVPHARKALRPGGLLVSYLPTIGQVVELRRALARGGFGMAETVEVLQRGWHIEGPSVRPDHRMVAHTGFLTVARWLLGEDRIASGASAESGASDGDAVADATAEGETEAAEMVAGADVAVADAVVADAVVADAVVADAAVADAAVADAAVADAVGEAE